MGPLCACGCGERTSSPRFAWRSGHNTRVQKNLRGTPEARFWAKIEVLADGCWRWLGGITNHGYGRFHTPGMRTKLAHRVAYQMFRTELPDDVVLDHLCRNRWCVNPDHLEPVSQRVNTLRGASPKITAHLTGICKRGHSLDVHGYRRKSTGLIAQCRECRREKRAELRRGTAA